MTYKLKIHLIPGEGIAPGLPKTRNLHAKTHYSVLFAELCAQFQVPPEQRSQYCLCTAHNNVIVTNFEVLSKYLNV